MKVLAALLVTALSCSGGASGESACREFSGAVPNRLESTLESGRYDLVMVATQGSRKTSQLRSLVTFLPTSASDRSPRTGETASDDSDFPTPLYGWMNGDLKTVGAPICRNEQHPPPDSQDPVYPGLLVLNLGGILASPMQPENAPVILVGTISNLRTGRGAVDGCGIGLFIQQEDDSGTFVGHWEEWGVMRDGSGFFCLARQTE